MSGETKKKPSKLSTCAKAFYIIVMAFYGLYGLYMAIKAYTKFRDLSKGFNNIVENWQQDIITDFQIVTSGATCPDGYSKEFTYNYGGASEGCDCRSNTDPDLQAKIYSGACNTNKTQAGCFAKPAVPSATIDLLGGSTNVPANGRILCVQRKIGTDFISLATKIQADGTCPTGHDECGSSAAADPTRLNVLCVPSDIGCPVMDIKNGGTAYTNDPNALTWDSQTVRWSKSPADSPNNLPLSELVLSINDVCKNDNNNAKEATNVGNYVLRRTGSGNQASCEGGTDSTFTPFLTQSYRNFLEMNNVWPTDADLAASYSLSDTMNLFWRRYFPLKKDCRGRAKEMEENDNEVDQMRSAQFGLLVVAAIVAIVIGFIIAIMDAMLLLHKNGICKMKEKTVNCFKSWKTKKECLSMTLKIINAGFLLWAVLISAKTKNFFSTVATEDCFDAINNALLKDFSKQVEEFVYKKNLQALISFCVAMLLTLIKLVLKCVKKKKKKDAAASGNNKKDNMKPGQIVPIDNKPKPAPSGAQQTPTPSHLGGQFNQQPTPPMGMAPAPPMQQAPM